MATNRWKVTLVALGGVVLLGMLLAAAFSLGVYVGEHGWTREGLNYQAGPPAGRGAPPTGGRPGGGVGGLPPGRPDVVGRIRRITESALELGTPEGPRTVLLTESTRFQDERRQAITLSDLKPGDVVAVFGRFMQGDGGQLQAEVVVKLPPPSSQPPP
ncbi:MAG: hypothetical protein D6770_10265 [Anaerolineae bacterium]|nr:MAG: hypothetical protein D6770_10265 [Anaerolineae bacterium]